MLGLVVTLNDRTPIRAGLPHDGVVGAIANVSRIELEGRTAVESMLSVGASFEGTQDLLAGWLRTPVRPGDEIRIAVIEMSDPDPVIAWVPGPEAAPSSTTGMDVLLNGVLLARHRLTATARLVAAMVTWSLGAVTTPTPGEYVLFDIVGEDGIEPTREIGAGDVVLLRMLSDETAAP